MTFPQTRSSGERCGRFRTSPGDIATHAHLDLTAPESLVDIVLGVYRLEATIGAGASGVVYRAWDNRGGRHVAVKVLREGLLATPEQRHRFRMEAIALGRCSHPSVAAVLDFGTCRGRDFLVMELVDGQLVSAMLTGEPLASAHAAFLGEQLARGLVAVHTTGVIHRDIKPGNLCVTQDGRLKILDFGLARPGGRAAAQAPVFPSDGSGIAGTLPYMAPEQIMGHAVDERTDVYAAGAVLFEMACGRRAFPSTDMIALLNDIRFRMPEAPASRNATIWPGLSSIIMKALAKQPADRFQSAAHLAEELAGATPSASIGAGRRPGRWRSMTLGVVRRLRVSSGPRLSDAGVR